MQIGTQYGANSTLTREKRPQAEQSAAASPVRAGLPAVIEPRREARSDTPSVTCRPVAALIAQIVAGQEDILGTRARRRIDPVEGSNAYRSVADLGADAQPERGRVL